MAAAGGVIVVLMLFMAFLAPVLAPKSPIKTNFARLNRPPDSQAVFGTDQLGRDMLSRVIYGSRISLAVGLLSVLLGITIGALWGLASGYTGGNFDLVSQRFLEVLMAMPGLILALALALVLGAGFWTIIIAIAVTRVPVAARVIRATAMSVKYMLYAEAARSIGASQMRVMLLHVAPQCFAPFIVLVTVNLGVAIITEASLSFIGLGVAPPTPTWGGMLGEASNSLIPQWWMVVFPGVFIVVAVLAFNLLGDGLRDVLDPRMRGAR
ncbi:MAG: ABC transporter permease [Chloroflexota bacterium]|nr:ABC transporter permease [Chloroflexota bacterium]